MARKAIHISMMFQGYTESPRNPRENMMTIFRVTIL